MPFLLLITPECESIISVKPSGTRLQSDYVPMMNGNNALPLWPMLEIRPMAVVCILRGRSLEAVWMAAV